MKQLKLDRKTKYTRMVLKDSLIELMKEKPITKITIKELCERADINRSTFYAHYSDQFDLLRKIEAEVLIWLKEAIIAIMAQEDKLGIIGVLEEICQYLLDNSQHLQVLMSEKGDIDFQKEIFTMVYEECYISSDIEKKGIRADEDSFIFAVNGSVGLIQHWLKNGFKKNARSMAETIFELTPNKL